MRRVSVVGSSGSGKTTVARRLAAALDVPYVELDALHWDPDWTAAPAELLRARTLDAIRGDAWVVDGNYQTKIGTLVWDRADTVVWVNPPRWRAVWRSFIRTVRRSATGIELWNGNREHWSGLMFWRGEDSILWWGWSSYKRTSERYEAAMTDPAYAGLTFHRLRNERDLARFFASVSRPR